MNVYFYKNKYDGRECVVVAPNRNIANAGLHAKYPKHDERYCDFVCTEYEDVDFITQYL